jgi:hypothetical protein
MLETISEISTYLTEVLGEESSHVFDEKIDNFVCYIKMSALTNSIINEDAMKKKIKKQAIEIIAASVRIYLDKNFTEDNNVVINIGFDKVFDKNLKPIPAINKIKNNQSEIIKNIIEIGMQEFSKGRELAYSIADRLHRQDEENGYSFIPGEPQKQNIEIHSVKYEIEDKFFKITDEIRILESKLPNINDREHLKLLALYDDLKKELN